MTRKCETCQWWESEEIPGQDNGKRAGNCRRYPPDVRGFPVTLGQDWCGEWVGREDA